MWTIDGGVAGHDDGIPGDANDDDGVVNTVPTTPGTGTTPTTIDDHGGDEDHSGPGRDGDGSDDHSGPGHGGGGVTTAAPAVATTTSSAPARD